MDEKKKTAELDRTRVLRHLRALIAALDRRMPQVERIGEIEIVRDAAALRTKALQRIARLEAESGDKSN